MGLSINLNSAALTAHRNLMKSSNAASKSIERLSSGYKINSASDDPAGLVISEKLQSQVNGLSQAISNAGDATNMVKTAEGALNEVSSLLQSMRTLAVHASNTGANDKASIAADQAQIESAIESLNNISEETEFGNKKLLDGTAGISTDVTNGSIISANLANVTNLGSGTTSVDVTVTQAATQTYLEGNVDLTSGVTTAGTIYINGVAVDYDTGDNISNIVSKINAASDETGVTASADTTSAAGKSFLVLTSTTYGSSGSIKTAQDSAITGGVQVTAGTTGKNIEATIKDSSTGADIGGTWDQGTGNTLEDENGNVISFAVGTTAATYSNSMTLANNSLTFQVGAYAGQTRSVSISSTAAADLGTTAVAGQNVSTIDVKTDAKTALEVLDAAISQVSTLRASLGAFQTNVLDSTVNSLTIAQENITASESTIKDTDMASEMTTYTSENILQQAGVSMLAQANQAPQEILKLLQS